VRSSQFLERRIVANTLPSDVIVLTAMGEQAAIEAKEAPRG
jgi:hypothetical protein